MHAWRACTAGIWRSPCWSPRSMAPAPPTAGDRSRGAGRLRPRPAEAKTKPKARGGAIRPGLYMGRPIADVMTFHGADWLFRPTREEEEQPEAMLDA